MKIKQIIKSFCVVAIIGFGSSCSESALSEQSSSPEGLKAQSLTQAVSDKVVVGYIPSWGNVQQIMDNTDLNILTHINIAFFSPNSSGQMMANGQRRSITL